VSAKKTELISLIEAVDHLNKIHGIDPKVVGRNVFGKQHIYNLIHQKKLERFGPKHMVLIDKKELENLLGPKKATG
jgi:hypothetical protein